MKKGNAHSQPVRVLCLARMTRLYEGGDALKRGKVKKTAPTPLIPLAGCFSAFRAKLL